MTTKERLDTVTTRFEVRVGRTQDLRVNLLKLSPRPLHGVDELGLQIVGAGKQHAAA